MSFLHLILTNLRRHRIRTLIGVAGIAFGVAAMLSVITILQGAIRMFERILSDDSEFVVFEKNVSDLFFSNVEVEDIAVMNRWSMVRHAQPVLFGIVSSPDNPVITCFGVSPEDARLKSARWLAGGLEHFGKENRGVVLGERASRFMHAGMGEKVAIGQGQFEVLGVIHAANGFEDGGVFMPLKLAQDYFHKQGVASIATVKLQNKEDKARFKEAVETRWSGLIALENEEFSRSYSQFRILKSTAWAVGGCAFLLGGLSVANTMIMSVFTRIREIAILRVCGFSRPQVAGLIFGESCVISCLGLVVGVGLSQAAMILLKKLPLLQGYVEPHLDAGVLVSVVGLACLTALAGAFYPAVYGMRIRATEALRFE